MQNLTWIRLFNGMSGVVKCFYSLVIFTVPKMTKRDSHRCKMPMLGGVQTLDKSLVYLEDLRWEKLSKKLYIIKMCV